MAGLSSLGASRFSGVGIIRTERARWAIGEAVASRSTLLLVVCASLLQCCVIAAQTADQQPVVKGTEVTCRNTSGNVQASVVLKAGGTPLEFSCVGEKDYSPAGLVWPSGGKAAPQVCKATGSVTDCENPVSLSDFIPGATYDWVEKREGATVVTIPEDKFPTTEQKFAVGCIHKVLTKPQDGVMEEKVAYSCMVTVTVEPPYVSDNIATCSYPDNVEANLPVKLTPSRRSFQLECGSGNIPQPSQYTKEYCTGTTVKNCTPAPYTNLFTGYQESWWSTSDGTANNNGSTLKFEIPEKNFPVERKNFLVGCEASSADTPTQKKYCNVAVTVALKEGSAAGGALASIHVGAREMGLVGIFVLASCFFAGSF
ncbi:surface antigen [Cystoisospora suis]|uniref:Surface antigen n=1 Tax=Cystoisospora suis TaxID=483139 RepID=A0A2C6LBD0_9APIC|nr:surface antigen [Cystoisospora suis]